MSVDRSRGLNWGRLVEDACFQIGWTRRQAWDACDVSEATWSRMVDATTDAPQPLDLWKLGRLPIQWWRAFLSLACSAVVDHWIDDRLTWKRQMLKADSRPAAWDGTERRQQRRSA